jgi:hypothetical protein
MYGGPRCPVCDEPVGVYERAVAFDDDGQRVTSLAREPELSTSVPTALVHETCAPAYHPNAR